MKRGNQTVIRNRADADGECFALTVDGSGCKVMSALLPCCGTFECPFYKPQKYRNWARIEADEKICLIPMEQGDITVRNSR